jgi:arylsulfatase A-like enzyme
MSRRLPQALHQRPERTDEPHAARSSGRRATSGLTRPDPGPSPTRAPLATRAKLKAAVAVVALVLGAPRLAAAVWSRVPIAVPAAEAEVADQVRPVFAEVQRREDGSFAAGTSVLEIPARARIEAWVAVASEREAARFRFVLTLRPEGAEPRAIAVLDPDREPGTQPGWRRLAAALDDPLPFRARLTLEATPSSSSDDSSSVGPVVGAPLLGVPILLSEGHPSPPRNVVLISLDTLRADRLSIYGAARATSPTIDRIARAGRRFAVALSPSASTPPSHMSLLTGTLPCRHGIWGTHVEDKLPTVVSPLAEILSANGYVSAAVTEDAYIGAPYGFARGFDSFREFKGVPSKPAEPAAVTPSGLGPTTFAAAREWVRSHRDERFFLFVHTYQMHGPRRPTARYADLFPGEPERSPSSEWNPEFHDLRRYDQLLREADDLVQDLVATIETLGLGDETLLVLTSDHGEAFFEHADHGHGTSLWEEVTRVPLIFWAPGLVRPGVSEGPAGLVDVVPTLLSLLGLPVPPNVDGMSFARSIGEGGNTAAEAAHRVLYMETAPGNARAARDHRYKMLRLEDGKELRFDLAEDPGEQRPLTSTTPEAEERLGKIRTELDRHERECREQRGLAAAARSGKSELDEVRRERLRALGYVE